jgi:hypothetical protein
MTRARGEPSRTLLDREYPHQVLVLAETLRGKVLDRVIDFHMNLGIGDALICDRTTANSKL